MSNYAQFYSPVSAKQTGYYRVPVRRVGDEHEVFVGDHYVRRFTTDSLPDFLKHRLAMIIASGKPEALIANDEITSLALFSDAYAKDGFEMIGWQASGTTFIVIMSNDELETLKGDGL